MSCRPRLLLLLLVTLVGSHTGRQPAGAQHQLTIKAATIAPPGSPLARQLEDLGTWLASLESPPFKLKVFAAGALGNEASVAKRTREGSLQLYAGSLSGLASVLPEVSVLLTPYLFKSIAQAERRLDRAVLKQLRPLLQEHGLVFAAWGPAQLRSYYSASAPLSGPKDFAGRPTHQRPLPGSPQVLAALNATAVAMPLGELSEALGDGRVDAFDDTLEGSFASGRIHRAQHLTLTHHGLDARIRVFSKRWLDGLPRGLSSNDSQPSSRRPPANAQRLWSRPSSDTWQSCRYRWPSRRIGPAGSSLGFCAAPAPRPPESWDIERSSCSEPPTSRRWGFASPTPLGFFALRFASSSLENH